MCDKVVCERNVRDKFLCERVGCGDVWESCVCNRAAGGGRQRTGVHNKKQEAERTASHGSQCVTLATGCALASARALPMQGKPALNRCTTKMPCR